MGSTIRKSPTKKLWAKLKLEARQMRHEPTEAEERLWAALRNRRLDGYKFRRQHAIGSYIADFCCPEAGLVVEIDGPVHIDSVERDRLRDTDLLRLGFRVLRFTNDDVLDRTHEVKERIVSALRDRTTPVISPLHSVERGRG